MPERRSGPSRGSVCAKSPGAERHRADWTATNATADGLLLEMLDVERLTIALVDAGWMSRALALGLRGRARRSHRQIQLCLRDIAAVDPRGYGPIDRALFDDARRTWRTMRRVGLRTLRRLDAFLAGT
jgi:hypothetical protein